jgi:hypothetical protein
MGHDGSWGIWGVHPDNDPDHFEEDDGLDADGNFKFECPAYWIPGSGKSKGYWHCPLAGTEECDWECKE